MLDGEMFISSRRASGSSGYAQDYIGYLARKGLISARRIGGLWYVSERSLKEYEQRAKEFKPVAPTNASRDEEPETFVSFDGREYVSAAKGADITGYHQDYIGQLARGGKVLARQVGTRWYVDRATLVSHKKQKDALLAVVQAKAVGLKRSAEMVGEPEYLTDARRNGAGPYMIYTRDDKDLMPVIADRKHKGGGGDFSPSDVLAPSHISDARMIPIRRFGRHLDLNADAHADGRGMKVSDRRAAPLKASGKYLAAAISAVAATIVIVVMVGYAITKGSPLYTHMVSDESGFALSGRFASAIARLGDFIEIVVAPEMIYKRLK